MHHFFVFFLVYYLIQFWFLFKIVINRSVFCFASAETEQRFRNLGTVMRFIDTIEKRYGVRFEKDPLTSRYKVAPDKETPETTPSLSNSTGRICDQPPIKPPGDVNLIDHGTDDTTNGDFHFNNDAILNETKMTSFETSANQDAEEPSQHLRELFSSKARCFSLAWNLKNFFFKTGCTCNAVKLVFD